MIGCTINSKNCWKENQDTRGIAKTYYLHKLLYQNIRSFLLHNISDSNKREVRSNQTFKHHWLELCRNFILRRKRVLLCHRENLISLFSLLPSFEERPLIPRLVFFLRVLQLRLLIFLFLLCIPLTIPPATASKKRKNDFKTQTYETRNGIG